MERSGTSGVDVSAQMSKCQPAGRRQASAAASGINLQASASAGRTQGGRRQRLQAGRTQASAGRAQGVGVSVCRSSRWNSRRIQKATMKANSRRNSRLKAERNAERRRRWNADERRRRRLKAERRRTFAVSRRKKRRLKAERRRTQTNVWAEGGTQTNANSRR